MSLFALPASDFSAIQDKIGLSDCELGARIFRGPHGGDMIRQFRSGERTVSPEVSLVMASFERDFERRSIAA